MRVPVLPHPVPAAAVLAACLVAAGCSDAGRLPVHPAAGQVLLAGKPVAQALVVLHPEDNAAPDPVRPQATAEPDGTFRLSTYETGDGAPAGTYRVTVTRWRSPAKGRGGPA